MRAACRRSLIIVTPLKADTSGRTHCKTNPAWRALVFAARIGLRTSRARWQEGLAPEEAIIYKRLSNLRVKEVGMSYGTRGCAAAAVVLLLSASVLSLSAQA